MDVIIVFLKITFIPVIFLLILTLISFILYLIGIPIVYRNHKAEKYFIQFFVSPVSIYLFSFVGAYNSLLALTFSPKTIVKIILIVYIFAILYSTFHKILKFEVFGLGNANKQDNELGEAVQNRIRFNKFNDNLYQKLIQMAVLNKYYFAIISFIIFLIFPEIGNNIYFGIPEYIANLF